MTEDHTSPPKRPMNPIVQAVITAAILSILGLIGNAILQGGLIELLGGVTKSKLADEVNERISDGRIKIPPVPVPSNQTEQIVFAECHGDCNATGKGSVSCPTGTAMDRGFWYYSVPDLVPSSTGAYYMCFQKSGDCPNGRNSCSFSRPTPTQQTGCSNINIGNEVGLIVAVCKKRS